MSSQTSKFPTRKEQYYRIISTTIGAAIFGVAFLEKNMIVGAMVGALVGFFVAVLAAYLAHRAQKD